MSSTPHHPQECSHERGPGTTVCLHCRREARVVAQTKRTRLMLRGAAGAIVAATVVTAGTLGASAMRDRNAARRGDSAVVVAVVPSVAPRDTTVAADTAPTAAVSSTPTAATSTAPTAATTPYSEAPSFAPVIPAGASTLANGVTAFRADSVITVSFDLPLARTRNPAKFERLVRATLVEVYGSQVDSLLAKLPSGSMSGQGDLLAQLPSTGMRIPISEVRELRVYPETRKGQDGPLVVRYRSLVCGSANAGCGAR